MEEEPRVGAMRYVSTRGGSPAVDFNGAMIGGLAPDGGLYVPVDTPALPEDWRTFGYVDAVAWSVDAYGASHSREIVERAAARFAQPDTAPMVEVGDRLIYELFWGPTLSFKDHALQVLAGLLARQIEGPAVVLGATSGDTGSAAIEACRGLVDLKVVVLFPEGMVTDFQRRQMTTVPDKNIVAVAVKGTFDDCQRLLKQAFAQYPGLLAVNSINWARIAAQAGYYVYLGAIVGEPFDVVVPTGNFGNAYSCWLAKQMGVPIRTITLANNANHLLADAVTGDVTKEHPVVPTLAPAMDIAIPSNFERFTADPTVELSAGWVSDDRIVDTIALVHESHGYLLDPHTATAWAVGATTRSERPQVVVATAHPSKFAEAVDRAIGRPPAVPAHIPDLAGLPERSVKIDPSLSDLVPMIR